MDRAQQALALVRDPSWRDRREPTDVEKALADEVERLQQRERDVIAALRGYRDSDLISLARAMAGCHEQLAEIEDLMGDRRRPAESVADAVRRLIAEA